LSCDPIANAAIVIYRLLLRMRVSALSSARSVMSARCAGSLVLVRIVAVSWCADRAARKQRSRTTLLRHDVS
jgi:hypothetical protein